MTELRLHLSELVKSSTAERVVVTRDAKPVAVLIGVDNEDDAERVPLAPSPAFLALFERSRRQITKGKGLTHDQLWTTVEHFPHSRAS